MQVLRQYYLRRIRRLLPAFYALLLLNSAVWLWEGTGRRNTSIEAIELALNLYKNPSILK